MSYSFILVYSIKSKLPHIKIKIEQPALNLFKNIKLPNVKLSKSKDLRKIFIKIIFYKIYSNKIHILITAC